MGPVASRYPARAHAAALLTSLGWDPSALPETTEPAPDLAWAASGAMALTGWPSAPPVLAPAPLASCARGAILALEVVAGGRAPIRGVDGAKLLGERAAFLTARRGGTVSATGGCRLLRARDGWLAVNLARPSDVELLPAWLDVGAGAGEAGPDVTPDTWKRVARALAGRPASEAVAQARLLGMPVAPVPVVPSTSPPWVQRRAEGPACERRSADAPLVVDLSTLWAGPLAASLLGTTGARVIKVESAARPDGARRGPAGFFDLMNGEKESVAVDLGTNVGRTSLLALLRRADIVVESARPRGLQQLGIDAAALVREVPGLVWVGITGYGRGAPEAGWVAFGDDAAAAAGLARAASSGDDTPIFCGDAIADPLTGLHAAVAALAAWRRGASCLLDLSLCDVTASLLHASGTCRVAAVERAADAGAWEVVLDDARVPVAPPSARSPGAQARALGADTERVLTELATEGAVHA